MLPQENETSKFELRSSKYAECMRAYNRWVSPRPLSLDTDPDIELRQIEGWRRMSSEPKAATVTALTSAAIEMALAGVRTRHAGESDQAQRRRLAAVILGPDLAARVFGGVPDAS